LHNNETKFGNSVLANLQSKGLWYKGPMRTSINLFDDWVFARCGASRRVVRTEITWTYDDSFKINPINLHVPLGMVDESNRSLVTAASTWAYFGTHRKRRHILFVFRQLLQVVAIPKLNIIRQPMWNDFLFENFIGSDSF